MAHADVVKKFGHRPSLEPTSDYEKVVDAAAASGTAVELSSAGLYKPVGEVYPAPPFLELFQQADVPITLASDAHYPHESGRDFDRLRKTALAAGYTRHVRLERRVATSLPL